MMLVWFVGPDTDNRAFTVRNCSFYCNIETNPNLISSACMNKLVDLALDKI